MRVVVKSFDGKTSHGISELSKLTKIEVLREKLAPLFQIKPESQRLFFAGKQLEDGNTLFDYRVNLNDVILLSEKLNVAKTPELKNESSPSSEDKVCDDFPEDLDIDQGPKDGPDCEHCLDKPNRKCKFCSCNVCGGKEEPGKQILCDDCNNAYHIYCLDPPLTEIPGDDWYCHECKTDINEVVQPGQQLKASRKRAKMASANSKAVRDWGKGMACIGKSKDCTVVPPDHFGPIPAVEVGSAWMYRVQASEAGVHRPHVAGIHGREGVGSFSIALSGGYDDDKDNGEEFFYSGSGGRDLSGNKRTAKQTKDQVLTRTNKALAISCGAPLNTKSGATATDWKSGKPIRVIRSASGAKKSKYCPKEGIRYDGIYKIVKYWPEKGKSGFIVWRYLFRRDDDSPAPWTAEGKKRIEKLGIKMEYPEGYEPNAKNGASKNGKLEKILSSPNGFFKPCVYVLPDDIKNQIEKDTLNEKSWKDCQGMLKNGNSAFLKKVEEVFLCVCCQELVAEPVTTSCSHNVCHKCLKMSFKAEVYTCPMCREDLGQKYKMPINQLLCDILHALFPGYDSGR